MALTKMNQEKAQNIPRRGEIYWVDFNYKTQRGTEIKKTRPSLIVSNDLQNEYDSQIIVAPLTSEEIEQTEDFEIYLEKSKENGLEKNSKILLNRLQSIDKSLRLKVLMGKIDGKMMFQVNKILKVVLALE